MKRLELKVPPVAVVLIVAVLIAGTKMVLPALGFGFAMKDALALAITAVGAAFAVAGVVSFVRAKTTVNPTKPEATSALVATGVYRYTRNPMYLGFLLALTGWALLVGSVPGLLWLPAFVLYMNRFQIAPEERALELRFGRSFTDYCGRVRRWI